MPIPPIAPLPALAPIVMQESSLLDGERLKRAVTLPIALILVAVGIIMASGRRQV